MKPLRAKSPKSLFPLLFQWLDADRDHPVPALARASLLGLSSADGQAVGRSHEEQGHGIGSQDHRPPERVQPHAARVGADERARAVPCSRPPGVELRARGPHPWRDHLRRRPEGGRALSAGRHRALVGRGSPGRLHRQRLDPDRLPKPGSPGSPPALAPASPSSRSLPKHLGGTRWAGPNTKRTSSAAGSTTTTRAVLREQTRHPHRAKGPRSRSRRST